MKLARTHLLSLAAVAVLAAFLFVADTWLTRSRSG